MSSPAIYLDNAATTRPLPEVVDAMAGVHLDHFGNPSSPHGFGEGPRKMLTDAREFLRGTVGASQLVLTSGGTEADLLGVAGAAWARPPGRVLVGAADHPAVLAQGDVLSRSQHRLVEVPVGPGGTLDPEALADLLGSDVRVVSVLHGHNELGGTAALEEIVSLVRETAPNAHIHVDLVQSYGKVPFDLDEAGVDSVAVSAHKLHGPRGVGFLACSSTARIAPLQEGGGQEAGMRGGTENVAGAVGLARAAEHALSHVAESAARMARQTERLFDAIQAAHPKAERLGDPGRRLPHVLSMRIPGVVAETLQAQAVERGLAFSTGAACHSAGEKSENHVLRAIGLGRRRAREVMRLSVCAHTTEAEVDRAAEIICAEATALTSLARGL